MTPRSLGIYSWVYQLLLRGKTLSDYLSDVSSSYSRWMIHSFTLGNILFSLPYIPKYIKYEPYALIWHFRFIEIYSWFHHLLRRGRQWGKTLRDYLSGVSSSYSRWMVYLFTLGNIACLISLNIINASPITWYGLLGSLEYILDSINCSVREDAGTTTRIWSRLGHHPNEGRASSQHSNRWREKVRERFVSFF